MAYTFVKFEKLSENIYKGVHNFHTNTLKMYLSNATPNVATHTQKSDLAEISIANGYAGPTDLNNTVSRAGATSTINVDGFTITASGGDVGPFRYFVVYDDDTTGDQLVGYYDYGSALTLKTGETVSPAFPTELMTGT